MDIEVDYHDSTSVAQKLKLVPKIDPFSHISRVSSIDQQVLHAIVYETMGLNLLVIFMHFLNDSFSSPFKRFKL